MGASVALLLPPHPDVAAIIADSAYARLDTILQRLTHYQLSAESMSWHRFFHCLRGGIPAFCWAAVVVSRLVFRLRFGHALIARPDSSGAPNLIDGARFVDMPMQGNQWLVAFDSGTHRLAAHWACGDFTSNHYRLQITGQQWGDIQT